jgi:hypothetical protein
MPIQFETCLRHLTNFYYTHPILAIALGVTLVLLVCFRPKAMLKMTGIVLALGVAIYFFAQFVDMAGTGRAQKKNLVETVQ